MSSGLPTRSAISNADSLNLFLFIQSAAKESNSVWTVDTCPTLTEEGNLRQEWNTNRMRIITDEAHCKGVQPMLLVAYLSKDRQ